MREGGVGRLNGEAIKEKAWAIATPPFCVQKSPKVVIRSILSPPNDRAPPPEQCHADSDRNATNRYNKHYET